MLRVTGFAVRERDLFPRVNRMMNSRAPFRRAAMMAVALLVVSRSTLLAQAAVSNSTSPEPTASPKSINPSDAGALGSPAPELPSVEQLDAMFKQTPLGKAADEARLHAQWRELGNRTLNQPDLVTARAQAEAARTDLEKRERLRIYYNRYFDRLSALADSQELKDFLEERRTEQIRLLAQDRVRPGSTPAALPSATATPKHKHKKHSAPPEPALPQ